MGKAENLYIKKSYSLCPCFCTNFILIFIYVFISSVSLDTFKSLTFRILITVNDGKSTWRIDGFELIHIFECNHEEAGTQMGGTHAYLKSKNVAVATTDTNVIVFMIYAYSYSSSICKWPIRYGKGGYADVKTICSYYGIL